MASSRHVKALLVAAALLSGTTLLTACQDDTVGAGTPTGNGSPVASAEAAAKPKGVSGPFTGGTVEYLAPGKYIVNASGKGPQQFFVAEDTKVYGAGTICGKYNPEANTPCTTDDLEKALKAGSVAADVTMKDGIANTVTERPAPDEGAPADDGQDSSGSPAEGNDTTLEGINKGKGVNGTWFGNVTYLAPGKYTVSGGDRTDQQFFTAEDTKILGTGDICGAQEGQAATECSEGQLEAAAEGDGVSAEVVIVNGIATTITDDR